MSQHLSRRKNSDKSLKSSSKSITSLRCDYHSNHIRSYYSSNMLKMLLLFGFWISNTILSCQALPHPAPQRTDFRPNLATMYGAPLITPLAEEVTLEVNTNYTLRCEANEDIIWRLPNVIVISEDDWEVKTFQTQDPERPFRSVLYLRHVQKENVGNYYCIKTSSSDKDVNEMEEEEVEELVNNNKASSIYLFVNDLENLLVPIMYPVGLAYQYQDFTIPCKPTVPNVEMLLTTPNGESYSSESSRRYDPRRGFVIQIRGVTDSGMYWCRPKVPSPANEEELSNFNIEFRGNEHIDPVTTTSTEKMVATLDESNVTNTKNCQNTLLNNCVELSVNANRTVNEVIGVGDGADYDDDVYNNVGDSFGIGDKNNIDAVYDAGANDDLVSVAHTLAATDVGIVGVELSDGLFNSLRSVAKRDAPTTLRPRSSAYLKLRSTPRPHTTHVNKPQITSVSRGHAYEGESFELVCEVKTAHDVSYRTEWTTPPGLDESRMVKKEAEFHNKTMTHTFGRAVLTVTNAQKSDSGNYRCIVTDHSKNHAYNNYLMTILKKGESYINISEPNDYYIIREKSGKTVQINVKYRGFPWPTLTWYRPDNTEILPTSKFLINITDTSITLKIINALMTDSGDYVIRAENGFLQKELHFNVSISGVPIVSVNDVYVQAGTEAHLVCSVLSYPPALVSWVFRPCSIKPRWPSCDRVEQSFNSSRNARPGDTSIEHIHELYFTPSKPGIAHCVAVNFIDKAHGKGHVLLGDIADNMTVYGIGEHQKIARGDELIITCAALAYYYAEDLEWFKDGVMLTERDGLQIIKNQSEYSYKKSLKFKSIRDADQGAYECRAKDANIPEQSDNRYIDIFVHEPVAPKMIYTNLDSSSKIELKLGDSLNLECKSEAIPRAGVTWYKDDTKLNANENIAIEEDNTKLVIPFIKPEDEGHYKCVVANRLGMVESSVAVKITNMPQMKLGWILGIVFFFIVLICLVIYLCVRVNRERKLLRELKAAGLANFEEGAIEHINPALTLDEQADLLPYDRRFEFPRHKLKLGKQLGAGAFGVVLKAHAEGIKADEKETVVAVKMVKRLADNEVMKALVSELKIMVHLGQHLNVVNLLGAVTENIAKREVMVIVEFCRFGNVQNFLLRNRKRFINQINPDSGKIDPTIITQRFSDNFELNRNTDNDPRSGTRAGRPNSSGYLRESELYEGQMDSCATQQTVMTTIPESEDNILSNNSVQPAWRSNYKPDSNEAMTITTSDLVSWAFQVARGMDYLSSRKVLHGDLAARNILLCEDNIVKICDFGLARSMYKSENYKKQGEAPLPIKWLALESLSDHVFSTYTDVWSFGIVLWEFFSLAKVPYPGMDPNQSLYLKLKDGYRMEKPPYANDDLYDIMLECWSTNPECRPLFHVLEQKFAKLLGDEVANHYLELNTTYLRANDEHFERNDTDYLAIVRAPDEMAPPPPRYVNGHILPEIRIESSSDDYLQMKSDTAAPQHSPTLANNLDSPASKSHKKNGIQPEEVPMLNKVQDSENEGSPEQNRRTPKVKRPAPQPSPRHTIAETQLAGDDNYVNVKSPQKIMNNNSAHTSPDAYYNPSYQMHKTVNEGAK